MMTSGLQIYNANPFLVGAGLAVSTLGGWLAGGRHWHFAAMWLFALNLLWWYLHLHPRRWKHRFGSGKDLKALQPSQNQSAKHAWHRLVYTAIIPVLLLLCLVGWECTNQTIPLDC